MSSLRALMIGSDVALRSAVETLLASAGYAVESAADARTGLAMLERSPPDVLVVDASLQGACAMGVVRRARFVETSAHMYVVVLSKGGPELVNAFESGADDVVKKPIARDELVARVDGVKRTRSLLAGSNHKIPCASDVARITSTRAWAQLDAAIAADLGTMLGEVPCIASDAGIHGASIGAEIPLSLPSENLEVRLRVAFDAKHLQQVGNAMTNDRLDAESLRDVAREIANVAGGALKRQLQREGIVLTIGLPVDLDLTDAPIGMDPSVRRWRADLLRGPFAEFEVDTRVRSNEMVSLGTMCEGMVLARSIRSPSGALLLAAGTRMTTSAIERLVAVLGPKFVAEVSNAVAREPERSVA